MTYTFTPDSISAEDADAAYIAEFKEQVRDKRNTLLQECDWTQSVTDNPLSDAKKLEWKNYREELRNFPTVFSTWIASQDLFSAHIDGAPWPTKPS